jgi:predicted transcriptional regulator
MGLRLNHKSWEASGDDARLEQLIRRKWSVKEIVQILGRTESAVRQRMYLKGLSPQSEKKRSSR